jgi:outer membrane protein TolC
MRGRRLRSRRLTLSRKRKPPGSSRNARTTLCRKENGGRCYNDQTLNALEVQVNISKSKCFGPEAQYREAKAAILIARSALWPLLTAGPSLSEVRVGGMYVGSGSTNRLYELPLDASWGVDLWGNLRRGVAASVASAQAATGHLENARLVLLFAH